MNSLKYFHINNVKFNYTLEFQSNHLNDYWKHNAPLLEYCETIGVNIPHYCYHKNLSISGNCRMCLVELKNSPKPIVSCAMSAKSCLNNSEIFTNSPLVKKARENVLEFLLLNHPLDCPICDQGGECDLQDQSLFFGISKKRFYNFKRIVTDKNIGPIVKTVMTRCIHCTRCVRFASEIAGTEDLGMFGRGLDSEIGTYVNKTFQSELSGNVVDLCPVGALTSKPYPFVSRSWELKNVNSIDFSDGFGSNLLIFIKNNKVTKISPGFNSTTNTNNWLSDKSRFSFEGMFSPERSLIGTIKSGNKENLQASSWKLLFSEIILTIYFQDHLSKHFLQQSKMFVIFDYNISLEVLNLLIILKNKYPFIELRKSEGQKLNNDLESNFTIKSKGNLEQKLNKSDMCFMVGLNSRYEGSTFNNALRKRYLKGNFKLVSLSSCKDLTFPETYLGLSSKHLNSIAEGNNRLCQELLSSINPAIVAGSETFLRKDHKGILNALEFLKQNMIKHSSSWDNLHVLNNSLNETGVNYLDLVDPISLKNFNESSGLYFLNSSNSLNIQKILNLRLLNYLDFNNNFPKICIDQTVHANGNSILNLSPKSQIYNYINLPNNSYFESTGSYITTEGVLKKSIKFIQATKQTKDDWQIIRKLSSYLNRLNFLDGNKYEPTLSFNNSTFIKYKTYTKFLYYASSQLLKNKTEIGNISLSNLVLKNKFRAPKSKLYSTKLKLWINDFYIGGKDPYSKNSTTMINCSKVFRLEKNNFSHIVL